MEEWKRKLFKKFNVSSQECTFFSVHHINLCMLKKRSEDHVQSHSHNLLCDAAPFQEEKQYWHVRCV